MKIHITQSEFEITHKLLEVLELFIGDDGYIRNSHAPLKVKGKYYVFPEVYSPTSFEFDAATTEFFRPLSISKIADHMLEYFFNFTLSQDDFDVIDGFDFIDGNDIALYCIGDDETCGSANKTSLVGCKNKNHAKVGVIIKHLDPTYDILGELKGV